MRAPRVLACACVAASHIHAHMHIRLANNRFRKLAKIWPLMGSQDFVGSLRPAVHKPHMRAVSSS